MEIISTERLKVPGQNQVSFDEHGVTPQIPEDETLVQIIYAAVNPVDAKSADLSPAVGATPGCGFPGKVTEIGGAVKKKLAVGDRACGVAVPGDLVFKIPEWMSLQSTTTVGIGLGTAASLSQSPCALVDGGGTNTSKLAIQLLRIRSKSLGAAEAFDYLSTTCAADIRAFTNNSIAHVFDCISDTRSTKICQAAFGSKGSRCVSLDPTPSRALSRQDVKTEWIILFTIFGRIVLWAKPFRRDPQPQDRDFAETWFRVAQGLVDDRALELQAVEERAGRFEGF